jgi:lipopolysaccharide export system protein LptA
VYEMKTNSIVLTGNVVVTRGQDVVQGHRLHVNMTTGHYRIDSAPVGGQSGPVRALINPGAQNAPAALPAPGAKPGAPAAAPAASPLPPPPPTGGRAPAAERTTGAAEKDAAKQGPSRPLRLN